MHGSVVDRWRLGDDTGGGCPEGCRGASRGPPLTARRPPSPLGTLDYSGTTFKSRDHAATLTMRNPDASRHCNIMIALRTRYGFRFCCAAPIGAYTRAITTSSSLGGSRRLEGHHQPGVLPGPRDPIPIGHVRTGSGVHVSCAAVGLFAQRPIRTPDATSHTPHRPVLMAHGLSYWRITRETFDC